MSTATARSCGVDPEAGVTESQGASSDAATERLPPAPELVALSVFAAGFAPPATALKDRLAGETASVGPGSTTRVTVTSFGEPAAPAAVTVTLPV